RTRGRGEARGVRRGREPGVPRAWKARLERGVLEELIRMTSDTLGRRPSMTWELRAILLRGGSARTPLAPSGPQQLFDSSCSEGSRSASERSKTTRGGQTNSRSSARVREKADHVRGNLLRGDPSKGTGRDWWFVCPGGKILLPR